MREKGYLRQGNTLEAKVVNVTLAREGLSRAIKAESSEGEVVY